MSHRDRLAVLYSNQVVFDRSGEPLVSVRITEGQDEVTVQSRGRLTLLPGGDDGARIRARAGTAWTVHVEAARPGEVRWWTIVEELPAGDLDAAADARRRWSALGGPVKLLESGALIGLAGQTLDTRRLHVGIDPQPTRAEAEAVAERLATGRELRTAVIAEPTTRPGGWIVARDPKTGFEVRARDLLWLTPEAGHTIDVPGLEWGHGTPKRGRADRRYHGDVYLAVGSDAKLTVVNVLSAETLLEGVVPAELFPSAPPAALRAQAVAARGQLLAKVGTRHRSDPYLLCAETHCQVYAGDSQAKKRTTAAVRATRGQLLFDAHGLVDTTYSSACGGHSEAFHQMWGGAPKASSPGRFDLLGGATDPIAEPPITDAAVAAFIDRPPDAFCRPSAERAGVWRWTRTRTGAEVDAAVDAHATARDRPPIAPIHTIRALRRGVSGRALAVEYLGRGGRHVVEGSYTNRTLLGGLRSGMWVVERRGGAPDGAPDTRTFRGGGFGHGVGLCQHGAIGMARAGHDHPAILGHYYPGGALRTAW
ncbi:MAG: SpoIID/LytB domain-containing protein [bacterium]